MINYVVKSKSLNYHIYVTDIYLPNGTEVVINGECCVVISNTGRI